VLTGRLADQYAQFEALPGLNVNGQLTLGENIGDNGGLSVALAAYRLSLQGKPAPVLANLTGEQRLSCRGHRFGAPRFESSGCAIT
jgi:putative endopeptidase